jgi:hypothetical protein
MIHLDIVVEAQHHDTQSLEIAAAPSKYFGYILCFSILEFVKTGAYRHYHSAVELRIDCYDHPL